MYICVRTIIIIERNCTGQIDHFIHGGDMHPCVIGFLQICKILFCGFGIGFKHHIAGGLCLVHLRPPEFNRSIDHDLFRHGLDMRQNIFFFHFRILFQDPAVKCIDQDLVHLGHNRFHGERIDFQACQLCRIIGKHHSNAGHGHIIRDLFFLDRGFRLGFGFLRLCQQQIRHRIHGQIFHRLLLRFRFRLRFRIQNGYLHQLCSRLLFGIHR